MSKNVFQMKYHAAKKEVEFKRFQDGEEIAINNSGALSKYMNMKGKFVLQDFGNTFFSDIAKIFDGTKKVEINAIMTKLDYEDLEQMIENYNSNPKSECEFIPTLLAELPDMKKTFEEVKKYGEKAIGILESHRGKLFEIPLDNENVKKSAESFASKIDEEIKNIKEKINSLSDNRVSLCFTGVYSAGKSALINAILGHKILPEDVNSKTAKMFRIYSPEKDKASKIIFDICNVYTVLVWNMIENNFEFKKGPSENETRKEIQNVLNDVKKRNLHQDEQIKVVLDKLNEFETVSSEIKVEFPVPLDKENVQFTIYDTPGTDSNYLAHQNVLTEALESQTQSILIFVAKPDGLEGAGNNALLNYLKEAEKKNSKTSIDIGRSLFVINKVDGQTADARKTLQHQEIKDQKDGEFTIKLEDKKLFFTSALYGYVAKTIKNGNASDQERALLTAGKVILAADGNPMSFCFRENRCASSEYATSTMISKCEVALEEAKDKKDDAQIVEICSGLYALETEILQYGEKYASAVKAFAIIDSVDKALSKLTTQACSLRESNREEIAAIEKNIRELGETINRAIEEEYNNSTIGKTVTQEIRKKLRIDNETVKHSLIGEAVTFLNKELKGRFFGLGKVKFKESDKTVVKDGISKIIDDFTTTYMDKREELLIKERDEFVDAVKEAINQNGNISEAAKKFFQDIPKPEVGKYKGINNIEEIYNSNKRREKILFIVRESLDKKGFIDNIRHELNNIVFDMADGYADNYRKSLETILMAIKSNFEQNLEVYSLCMKAMMTNKEAMQKLGNRIEDAAEALADCENSLNTIIWKED